MSYQNTWQETLHNHSGQYFTIKNILYQDIIDQQELMIFENALFGRVMILDGILQTTELDEFIYHEMIVHVPLITHSNAKKVLIIGGGDGGTLREVIKHSNIEQITMVEINSHIVTLCKQYLPYHNAGSFNDPRLNLVIADGLDFISKSSDKFDVIISDGTDPIGPGKNLFNYDFYHGCSTCLNKDGIFVAQNGVCFLQQNEVINTYHKLKSIFKDVCFYQTSVPTYYGGIMTFAWASDNPVLRKINKKILETRIEKIAPVCRYYNAMIHHGSFALPQYLINSLSIYNQNGIIRSE